MNGAVGRMPSTPWVFTPERGGAAHFASMLPRGVSEGIIVSNRGPTMADVGQ